jgi:hypothetical protein
MATSKRIKHGLILVLAGSAAIAAVSQAAEVRPVFVAGYDTGGDKIVNAQFTNGASDSIQANEGLYVGGGISVLNEDKNIEFQGTASYKYASIHADNGDITWTSIPLDALLFYRMRSFRVGGGLTFVMSPKLKGSGVAGGLNTNVDNAVGVILQADYLLGKVAIGLRGTFVDYKAGGVTAKGNGVGVTFGITF